MKRYISTTQAAALLNRDRSRVKQLLAQGRVKGAIRFGRAWAIPFPPTILPVRKRNA